VASLKIIRKRIGSVRNTQQVTKAMKMVSAAKLRRAQLAAEAARAYSDKLTELLRNLSSSEVAKAHPLMRPGIQAPAHLILVTADKGLCGAYNANLIRLVANFLAGDRGAGATLTTVGRRGRDYFGKRGRAKVAAEHVQVAITKDLARAIARDVSQRFLNGEAGEVYLVYTRFRSAISQAATLDRLLPLVSEEESVDAAPREYVYEPSAPEILASLLPRYVETRIYHALLESAASEHGARMTAMDNATRNAREMIDRPHARNEPRTAGRHHQGAHGDRGRGGGAERLSGADERRKRARVVHDVRGEKWEQVRSRRSSVRSSTWSFRPDRFLRS
jgi:F-type H+-transporting ATPase subunit gamma